MKDFEEGLGFMQSLLEDAIGAPQVINFLFIFISCFFNVLTSMKKKPSQLGSLDVYYMMYPRCTKIVEKNGSCLTDPHSEMGRRRWIGGG